MNDYSDVTHWITRRRALAFGASLLAARPIRAWGQEADQYATLTPLFADAQEMQDSSVNMRTEKVWAEITTYIEFDYRNRRHALFTARESGVFESPETAIQYVYSIPDILPDSFPTTFDSATLQSQERIIAALSEDGLPIVPQSSAMTPANIPAIIPRKESTDSDAIVLGDIVLETLGISLGDDSLIISFINTNDEIKHQFEKLVEAVSSKEWTEVAFMGERIFQYFIGSSVFAKTRNRLGRKLTFGLALRCVPVVGWAYVIGAFVVAVKSNYDRFSFA